MQKICLFNSACDQFEKKYLKVTNWILWVNVVTVK